MTDGPRYRVPFRRRREGKTDYKKRLALLKSGKTRVVVRRSLQRVTVQFANYSETGDVIIATATSVDLKGLGWDGAPTNTPAAYLVGLLAGKRASAKNVKEGVLDIGRHNPVPGSRVFAALKGVVDAGVDVPHGENILPDDARIAGGHLEGSSTEKFNAVKAKIQGEA
ncbi:MAG: 50S ribosomal protein L18 [Euryarchaeota archaeon]|nr:50S ribosomal protein L18 [Euryarchaeota archaeon]